MGVLKGKFSVKTNFLGSRSEERSWDSLKRKNLSIS
jgi:hypothetical protein